MGETLSATVNWGELQVGDVVGGDFRVNALLARGGMGVVYDAEQISTGRTRALKVMHPDLVPDAKARDRFLQEARIGARVESQHIVEVVAAGVDDGGKRFRNPGAGGLPGHSRRIILGWNASRDAPRSLAHWKGQIEKAMAMSS